MPVPSSLADLSTTASSNYPAGTDAIGTSLDDYLRSTQALLKQSISRGTDIASEATITIPANGNYCVVTGTTNISSIADSWNGRVVTLTFSGNLVLSNSAALILPGGENLNISSGDCVQIVNESVGVWRCVSVNRADGNDYVSVKDFGAVGDGVADDTSAIQSAINYISNSNVRTLRFPAGTYNFTRLYCYYDASLNPGYNQNRNAKITLQGDGTLPEVSGVCGTILNSTVTTGDCLIVSGIAEDAAPYRSRDFNMRDMTIQGNTTGYLIRMAGVVVPHLEYVNLIQSNVAGSGLYISTAYFATLEKMRFSNDGVGTKTGSAIRLATSLAGGLFTMRDCNISGFDAALFKENGSWQNINIYDSELAATGNSIYIATGTLDVLNIQGCYFEGSCTSFISVYPEFGLNTLNISGSWFYSNDLSGRAINLRKMGALNISGCHVVNQYTEFLNIDDVITGYNGGGYSVNGIEFNYSVNPTSDVYYFVGGVVPALYAVDYPASVSYCHLHTINARPIKSLLHFGTAGTALFAGHVCNTMTYNIGPASGNTIPLQGVTAGCPSFVIGYFVTNPSTIVLPANSANPPHGFNVIVTSHNNSSTTVDVALDAADGGTVLATLSAGQQRTFVYFNDGVKTGWM